MAESVKNYGERARSPRAGATPAATAGIVKGLKEIYDPVAKAPLPACFGRPLGLLYFITSEAGALARLTRERF